MTEYRTLRICSAEELDIVKTFECGQCFRWNSDDEGVYTGVISGHLVKVWESDGSVYVRSDLEEVFLRDYFDLGLDYAAVSAGFNGGEYLDKCISFGAGIRILRQEPWEALCSFIISQCNNISRIKGIVERLCENFGKMFEAEGRVYYSFPSAERLAVCTAEDLACIRSGYRASYIITAAAAVASGELELEGLKACDYTAAKKTLLMLNGVGEKVANCVVLFGLHHMEAFPIDTWIRQALKTHFAPDFDPSTLGPYAGLAQQYIFFFARSTDNS